MTIITTLGIASLVFVVLFTASAYGRGINPRKAIIEAWVNIVIGFSINYTANLIFLPMLGASLSASSNLWLGWIYTAISILRQYAIRRWFQERLSALIDRVSA